VKRDDGGMPLVRLSLDLSVPSIGSRPPLLRLATEIRLGILHMIVGGAVAAGIVWVAVGTPVPEALRRSGGGEDDQTPPARLTRV